MKCEWKECTAEATQKLFRPVEGIMKDLETGVRIWNINFCVCLAHIQEAQKEYPEISFVKPGEH